jgi:Fur family ferric uptake transcriptional regulator
VLEFQNDELEKLKAKIARDLGYDLIGDRLELYGIKRGKGENKAPKAENLKAARK